MNWSRAGAWLRSHAPELRSRFLPPATAADVAAAEEAIGVPLPADLTTWWMACGGLTDVDHAPVVPEFYSPFSVGRSLEVREAMMRIRREVAVDPRVGDVDSREARKLAEPAGSLIGDLWLPLWENVAAMLDAVVEWLEGDFRSEWR